MVQAADWHASREILGAREPYLRPYKAGTVSYEDREVDKESEYSKTDGNLQIDTIKSHGAGSLENKAIVGNYEVNWKLEKLQTDHGCGIKGANGWPCGKKRGANCPDCKWWTRMCLTCSASRAAGGLTHPKSRTGRKIPIVPVLAQALQQHLKP